jgi:hypothetical protein
MTYHAKITDYDFDYIRGKRCIAVYEIEVYDENGNHIRKADLKKIERNLHGMQVTFAKEKSERTKTPTDITIINNLLNAYQDGQQLTEIDAMVIEEYHKGKIPMEFVAIKKLSDGLEMELINGEKVIL